MASTQEYVDFVLEHIDQVGEVTAKKMFGEYAIYADGKMFGSICDNKLFIKPTNAGRAFIGSELVEAPPYPGAKPNFLVVDKLEDRKWLNELIKVSLPELPFPKKRKKKK